MKNKITCESNTNLRRILLSALLVAALAFVAFNGPTPASAAVATNSEPVVFADKIVDGVIPKYIDGDKVDIGPILNPFTRDGGGSQYISSEYIRNKTIGNIFNWTSASSVTKSNGFDIDSTISAKVFGINMSINIGWKSDTAYTWTKSKGYSLG